MVEGNLQFSISIQAIDADMARALGELYAIGIQSYLRHHNSGWITDNYTSVRCTGMIDDMSVFSTEWYDEKILTDAFGEESAIRLSNWWADYE